MLIRKIDTVLDTFYDNTKMALMLTGARQVGKTNAFRRLARRKFERYIAIFENVLAQELLAQGFEQPYYFNSKKQGEVDFVIEAGDGTAIPIEVKSGKDYERHNALTNILDNEEYNLNKAIVLCNNNVSVQGKKVYLPIYMTTFIRKKQEIPGIYKLEL